VELTLERMGEGLDCEAWMNLTKEDTRRAIEAAESIGHGLHQIASALYDTLGSEKMGNALDGLANVSSAIVEAAPLSYEEEIASALMQIAEALNRLPVDTLDINIERMAGVALVADAIEVLAVEVKQK
jgi:hypothetical protein